VAEGRHKEEISRQVVTDRFHHLIFGFGGIGMKITVTGMSVLVLVLCLSVSGLTEESEEDPSNWKGDLALGISLSQGNTDKSSFSFSYSADKLLSEKIEWNNKGIFLGGKSEGKTDSQSLEVWSTLKWNHTERLFTHYEILVVHDKFKNYRYRLNPNIGIGYRIIQTDTTDLALKTGFSETFTRFDDTGETDSFAGLFLGNDFKWTISESAEFSQNTHLNWDLSDTNRFLLRIELSLVTSIVGGLGLKLSLIDKYDSEPESMEIKKNDLTFLTNISLKF
jgi:putative salt-induced outer membrane protein YdiY